MSAVGDSDSCSFASLHSSRSRGQRSDRCSTRQMDPIGRGDPVQHVRRATTGRSWSPGELRQPGGLNRLESDAAASASVMLVPPPPKSSSATTPRTGRPGLAPNAVRAATASDTNLTGTPFGARLGLVRMASRRDRSVPPFQCAGTATADVLGGDVVAAELRPPSHRVPRPSGHRRGRTCRRRRPTARGRRPVRRSHSGPARKVAAQDRRVTG